MIKFQKYPQIWKDRALRIIVLNLIYLLQNFRERRVLFPLLNVRISPVILLNMNCMMPTFGGHLSFLIRSEETICRLKETRFGQDYIVSALKNCIETSSQNPIHLTD